MSTIDVEKLFNFTADDALNVTKSKKSSYGVSGLYKPSYKDEKCTDGNYRALVRFMPFAYEGEMQTTIERWECFLKDVNDGNGIFVVSPKTIGEKCVIRDAGWRLYSSKNAIEKANSKKINVYQQWYALVEIIKDVQHPEYNGKFMIYQFGKKIFDKIEIALHGSEFKPKEHVFDLFEAKLFEINITKGSQKMENGRDVADYTACGFIDKKAPLHFGEGKTLERNRESMIEYVEWLEKDAPKITDFYFKPWDQATIDKVNANLATYFSEYSAPRTTTAQVNEDVKNIIEKQPSVSEDVNPVVVEESGDTIEANDDDDWINSVLNN